MFIPYKVDVPFDNQPVMNWLVFVGVILAFVLQVAAVVGEVGGEFTSVEQAEEEKGAEGGGRAVYFGWLESNWFVWAYVAAWRSCSSDR